MLPKQRGKTSEKAKRKGIDAAKSKGVRMGRPPSETPFNFDEVKKLHQKGEITASQTAKSSKFLGVSRTTYGKWAKQ